MNWQPIETAPKDGTEVVLWGRDWRPFIGMWKINPRIVLAHKKGESLHLAESYFGDRDEMDDYEMADPSMAMTHWLPIPETPK